MGAVGRTGCIWDVFWSCSQQNLWVHSVWRSRTREELRTIPRSWFEQQGGGWWYHFSLAETRGRLKSFALAVLNRRYSWGMQVEMLCRQLHIGACRNQGWSLRFGSSVLLFTPMGLKKSLRENG